MKNMEFWIHENFGVGGTREGNKVVVDNYDTTVPENIEDWEICTGDSQGSLLTIYASVKKPTNAEFKKMKKGDADYLEGLSGEKFHFKYKLFQVGKPKKIWVLYSKE